MEGKGCGWADFSSIRFKNADSENHAREIVLNHIQEYGFPEIFIEFDEHRPVLRILKNKNKKS